MWWRWGRGGVFTQLRTFGSRSIRQPSMAYFPRALRRGRVTLMLATTMTLTRMANKKEQAPPPRTHTHTTGQHSLLNQRVVFLLFVPNHINLRVDHPIQLVTQLVTQLVGPGTHNDRNKPVHGRMWARQSLR